MKIQTVIFLISYIFIATISCYPESSTTKYALVINDTLIREGPGIQYRSIKQAFSKEELEYSCNKSNYDCTQDMVKTTESKNTEMCSKWYEVEAGNRKGWVSQSFFIPESTMNLESGSSETGESVNTENNDHIIRTGCFGLVTNDTLIREGPGENFVSIQQAFKNDELRVTCSMKDGNSLLKAVDLDNGKRCSSEEVVYWYEVHIGDEKGWIKGDYLYTNDSTCSYGTCVFLNRPSQMITNEEYSKFILHNNFFFLESVHNEQDGWPSPPKEEWLVSKDWIIKHHVTSTMIRWSFDRRYLMTDVGIFDTVTNQFANISIEPDKCSYIWTKNGYLLFTQEYTDRTELYVLYPKTGNAVLKYTIQGFGVEPVGACYDPANDWCPGDNIQRMSNHLTVPLYNKHEKWLFAFDEDGKYIDKKFIFECGTEINW